jgi:hypothetical protein
MDENQSSQAPAPALTGFEEMGTPEQLAELYGALAAARGGFGEIVKGRSVTITPKDGGRPYTFNYAELSDSLAAVVPALSANGLVVIQPFSMAPGGAAIVRTILAHKSGARLVSLTELLDWKDVKGLGGIITYLRRYALNAMLCLAADEDADDQPLQSRGEAHAESGPRRTPQTPQTRPAGAQPSPTRAAQPGAAPNGSGVAKTPAGSSPAAQSNGQPGQSANAAPSPAGASAAQPGPAEAQPVPLSREQWDQLLRMCSAAGATEKEDQRSLISGFLPDGTTKPDASHFKTLVTKLGQLAIDRKESANV